ncbi:MAG: D-2-hydroxyacid dehydrogenase [Geminicoccaceae bacterium]
MAKTRIGAQRQTGTGMKRKIVFLDRLTLGPSVEVRRPSFDHEWIEHERSLPEQVAERIADADLVITNKAPVREAALAGAPGVKMISVAATGYDIVDIEACRARGITVSNVRGYAVNTVPEHTFALILALRRSIVPYRASVMTGRWQEAGTFCYFDYPIRDLAGSTIAIMGEGSIGQSVATIARAFGMTPLFVAHKGVSGLGPLYTPWEEALERADILSIHAPLTASTRNMIGMQEFRSMKRRPIIVNCARGGLVDEAALVRALDEGLISGIGFDVLTSEPPAADNPLLSILDRPNVVVTPHVAWASEEAQQNLWDQTIEALDAFVAGKPVRTV